MKIKIRRRRKTFKVWYLLVVLIVILIFISSSYALWNTKLYINGNVSFTYTEPQLPVEIPSQGTDANGVNRFTTGGQFKFWNQDFYKVVDETYSDNIITTTLQENYKQILLQNSVSADITLTIPNNTSSDFTDGTIELIEQNDTNGVLNGSFSTTLSSTTISAGETATATITGSLKGYVNVATNTYYNFAISYKIGETRYYFYYNLIILPK